MTDTKSAGKRLAVLLVLSIVGCGHTAVAVPDPRVEAAHDVTAVMPEYWPIVDVLLDDDIAANREELLALTQYFRLMCGQRQAGFTLDAGGLQADMERNAGKHVGIVGAADLVAAFDRTCPARPQPPVGR